MLLPYRTLVRSITFSHIEPGFFAVSIAGRVDPSVSPFTTKQCRLLQHCLCRFLLFVWWVAVFAQNALNQYAQLCADILPYGPVDGDISTHGLNQLTGDGAQRLVT